MRDKKIKKQTTYNYTPEDLVGRTFRTGKDKSCSGYFIISVNKAGTEFRLNSINETTGKPNSSHFGHSAVSILDSVNDGSWTLDPMPEPQVIDNYPIF